MILRPSQLAANSSSGKNSSGKNSRREILRNLAVARTTIAIAAESKWAIVAMVAPKAERNATVEISAFAFRGRVLKILLKMGHLRGMRCSSTHRAS